MKNNYVVFKMSKRLQEKLIDFYKDYELDKKPPYSIFQAKNYDVTITLYESGKVMFQGVGADLEAQIWIETEKKLSGNIDINSALDKKDNKKETNKDDNFFIYDSSIGSDETGCGDFFGPVVVCATYVSKENINILKDLGVKDSKKVDDSMILKIAPKLVREIPYSLFILDNKTYNNFKDINMVKLKCILHNKALINLINKYHPDYKVCVIDQFVNEKKYYEYLTDNKEILRNIKFYTKGESKCMSVAAASIIARYTFIKEMEKLEKEYNLTLPKGAGTNVDEALKNILNSNKKDILYNISKLNFNNYKKLTTEIQSK